MSDSVRSGLRPTVPWWRHWLDRLIWLLPEGRALPDNVWNARHRGMLVLLWLHAIAILIFAAIVGKPLSHGLAEAALVAGAALLAHAKFGGRKFQAGMASFGLVTAASVLVHLSGGYIEMHFHFFVIVAIVSLYQDWVPFLIAIGYVVFHHGVIGVLDPTSVYNHPDAWAHPWKWAMIHGAFIVATSLASIVAWRLNEALRAHGELILRSAGEGILGLDQQGKVIFINPSAARLLRYSSSAVIGKPISAILRPLTPAGAAAETAMLEGTILRPNGDSLAVEYISTPIRERSQAVGTVVTFNDITARKQAAEALRQANAKLVIWVNELEARNREISTLGEMTDLLQVCETPPDAYRVIAQAAQKLFSSEVGALIVINSSGNLLEAVAVWGPAADLANLSFTPGDCWALRRAQLHLVEADQVGLICGHVQHFPAGGYLCVPLMALGEVLGVLHLQGSVSSTLPVAAVEPGPDEWAHSLRPIAKQQQLATNLAEQVALALANVKLRETLRIQSIRDPLTGLYNRRYLEETLERELHRADRHDTSLGLILLDIDHFKTFNDTFGHAAGDSLLRNVGALLQSYTRHEDIACRYGGEEFVLILPGAALETTRQRAEQVSQGVRDLLVHHHGQALGRLTFSAGVAVSRVHGSTSEALLNAADLALYRAKHEGRDRVIVATPA